MTLLCAVCSVQSVKGKKKTGSPENAEGNTKEPQSDCHRKEKKGKGRKYSYSKNKKTSTGKHF